MRIFKSFHFIAIFFLSISSFAEQILIFGQAVEASQVSFRAGPNGPILHSAQITEPTVLNLPRGNSMVISGLASFHDNGGLWMVEAQLNTAFVNWVLPSGKEVKLNCSQPPVVNGNPVPQKRIQFYPNGEYFSGCRAVLSEALLAKSGDWIEPEFASEIDLTSDGFLRYARIQNGRLSIEGQVVSLQKGTALDFHDNGSPHFFTLAKGESFNHFSKRFGTLKMGQKDRPLSTQFNSSGQIENGILDQDLVIGKIHIPKGSGLSFEKQKSAEAPILDEREFVAILTAEQHLDFGKSAMWVSQILWNGKNQIIGAVTSRSFVFQSPEGDEISVPIGARIYLNLEGKIVRIDLPPPPRGI